MSALTVTEPRTAKPKTGLAAATWYVQKGSNDTWFRCDAPAEAVGGKVSYLHEKTLDRAVTQPNKDTNLPWFAEFDTPQGVLTASTKKAWQDLCRGHLKFTSMRVVFPEHEGIAVWTRPCGRRAVLALEMARQGIVTVAETDDNYFSDKKFMLRQRQVGWDDAAMDVVARAMCSMDRNVFSTAWLRDRYLKEYRKRLGKKHLPEMFVCRNHIPRAAWPERSEGDGRVRVGFMGSGSHVWDINIAYAAFHAAKTFGAATTTMIGYSPSAPDKEPDEIELDGETVQIRSEKSKRIREKWAAVVDTHIDWIDPGEYRRASLPLDIGLCPLWVDDFTMGKSDSKMLEYTISGAAGVCWNTPVYNSAGWKHEVNCLMASSWREMADATLRLLKDPKLRFDLVSAAQDYVFEDRNETHIKDEWGAALEC